MYLSIIKATYDRPTVNILVHDEKSKAFAPRSGTRQGCLLSKPLLHIVLRVLANSVTQEKK